MPVYLVKLFKFISGPHLIRPYAAQMDTKIHNKNRKTYKQKLQSNKQRTKSKVIDKTTD